MNHVRRRIGDGQWDLGPVGKAVKRQASTGKIKVQDGVSWKGGWGLSFKKHVDVYAPLDSHIEPGLETTKIREQMYQLN